MGYIQGENRNQKILLPETIDEYIEEDNITRLIDAFADNLNLEALGFEKSRPAAEGRPGFDPHDMLKLYFYGYFYGIRSSRKIARQCYVNIEVMWLMKKLKPDFRTIADFRKTNTKAIKNTFKEFNRFCHRNGLFSEEGISIDGSKFRAVNSKDRNFTQSKLDDRLERIDAHIEDYLRALDEADLSESEAEKLQKKLKEYQKRKGEYEWYQKKMCEENLSQLSLTDSESKLMKVNDGFDVCYNTQTAVDVGSHLIADFEVTSSPTDHGQLAELAQKVREDFEEFSGKENTVIESLADKGYQDANDMAAALENGIVPNVIQSKGKTTAEIEFNYEEAEIDEQSKKSTRSEDLKKCLRAGIIPEVYKDILEVKGVEEKSHYEYESTDAGVSRMTEEQMYQKALEGYYVRNPEGNYVYCPMGKILRQKSIKKNGYIRYCNKLACKNCKNKCTKSDWKEVDFSKDSLIHKCQFNGNGREKGCLKDESVRKIKKTERKAVFILKLDVEKQKKRMCTSEHPFGTVKRAMGGYYYLLKGKQKVEAETSLMYLAYNMKRAVNIAGVRKLLSSLA